MGLGDIHFAMPARLMAVQDTTVYNLASGMFCQGDLSASLSCRAVWKVLVGFQSAMDGTAPRHGCPRAISRLLQCTEALGKKDCRSWLHCHAHALQQRPRVAAGRAAAFGSDPAEDVAEANRSRCVNRTNVTTIGNNKNRRLDEWNQPSHKRGWTLTTSEEIRREGNFTCPPLVLGASRSSDRAGLFLC
jgi:hypothetical protein